MLFKMFLTFRERDIKFGQALRGLRLRMEVFGDVNLWPCVVLGVSTHCNVFSFRARQSFETSRATLPNNTASYRIRPESFLESHFQRRF